MKIAKYKSAKSTYNLPSVYFVDNNNQYISVNKPQKQGMTYKVSVYIPAEETTKTVELNELDKVPIIKELKPLSLKVGDVYEAQVANNKKMKFTVVSVNDDTNELQLKVEAQGKNTTVTNEWSITDFTALYYQLGESNFTISRKADKNNKKTFLIVGGIVAAIGLFVLIKKAAS